MNDVNPRWALKDGFKHWLDAITSSSKVEPGIRLYPFSTSRRSTAVMLPLLVQIDDGQPLSVNDATQAVTDLRGTGLVTGQYPDQTLTEFGVAVLALWRDLKIDNINTVDEVARCAALVRGGVEFGVRRYVDAYRFWCMLTESAPAEYWFTDIYTLCMPAFLDQPDTLGYNPFRVITALNDGGIGEAAEWRQWAADDTDEHFGAALTKLLDRVKASHRVGGCRAFCRGMEAYRLAQYDPESLQVTLRAWEMAE